MDLDDPRTPQAPAGPPTPGSPDVTSSGRRCVHPDCETELSRYNPDPHCSRHGGWSDATVSRPGRKPTLDDEEDRPRASNGVRPVSPTARRRADASTRKPDPTDAALAEGMVLAEMAIEPSLPGEQRRSLFREVGAMLRDQPLQVRRSPFGVVVVGDLSVVMDATEQAHRLAATYSDRVVTTLKVIGQQRSEG